MSRELLGKRVVVTLDRTEQVIVTGRLLGVGQGGDFEIECDDGMVHYCWPMLEIAAVPTKPTGGQEP